MPVQEVRNTIKNNNINVGQTKPKKGPFKFIDSVLSLDAVFEKGIPLRYVPRILFISAITLFYIGNNHFANKTIIKLSKTKTEVDDLRVDYTTLKSDYMYASKQSEVARRVASLGLEESSVPPHILELYEE